MVKTLAFLILLNLSLISNLLTAQEGVVITNRSTTIQYIDGHQYYFHAVLQGQTLYSIARAYEVSQEAILRENPDIRDGLRYNQIIRIPVQSGTQQTEDVLDEDPATDDGFITHKVKRRETLFGLSRQYDVSIDDILHHNPESREGLKIGQLLRIPVAVNIEESDKSPVAHIDDTAVDLREQTDTSEAETETEAYQDADTAIKYLTYNVMPGDTRFGISRRFGISIEDLDALNPGIVDGLNAGQQLRIPAGAGRDAYAPADDEKLFMTIKRSVGSPTVDESCYNPVLKDEYRVALLIPFYLEDLIAEFESLNDDGEIFPESSNDNILVDTAGVLDLDNRLVSGIDPDHTSFTFINYYHGVLLALDSIRQQGVNIRLFVEDVCQDVRKAQKITAAPEFLKTDLIIGPFHRQSLDYIADYGRRNNIPVVSPLLPDNRQLRGFPNLLKATPSLETMLDGVARYVSRTYPQQNIIIVHNQQPGAAPVIKAFQDTLLSEIALANHVFDSLNLIRVDGYYLNGTYVGGRRTNVPVMPDTVSLMVPVPGIAYNTFRVPKPYNVQELIYRYEGMHGLQKLLRKDRQNILITLVSGEPFLSDYLRQLHAFRHNYDISVFGIPEWQDYASIEIDYLQNLRVHFFVPDYYDYKDPHIKDFVKQYRKIFQTEPSGESLKAAQTAYFFFSALAMYGADFQNCLNLLNHDAVENPFHFHRPFGKNSGWENKHFYIYRIENYRRVDMNRPVKITDIK